MTNIPTDLLRTLVAVVDLRSFTKAAASLGVTQPAVSAQIKRLQFLLGGDLFDRSVQGVSLTPQGELVVSYARRLLSINDQVGPRSSLDFVNPPDCKMPDFRAYIREHLPPLGASGAKEAEVIEELALDFEERYKSAIRGGLDPSEAWRKIQSQTEWPKLARDFTAMLASAQPDPPKRLI